MQIYTTDSLKNKNYEEIGLVKGSTVRAKHMGKDILASFKQIVGGELTSYQELLTEARAVATKRMVEDAQQKDADAIIAFRFSSSSIMDGASEILAYGTAIKFI